MPEPRGLNREPASRRRSLVRRTLVATFLSAVLVFAIARSVPMTEVGRSIRGIEPAMVLVATGFALVSLWLRGGRWALLFSTRYRVRSSAAAEVALLGVALNAVLPGRLGELMRVGIARKRFGTSVPFTAATVVAERLLDGITLLSLLGLSLASLPEISSLGPVEILGYQVGGGMFEGLMKSVAGVCLAIAVGVAGLGLPAIQRSLVPALARSGQRPGRRWLGGVAGAIDGVRAGFGALRSPVLVLRLAIHSLAIWTALVLCNWTAGRAFDGLDLSFGQAIMMSAVSVAAAALPSAPGGWGVFEAGGLLALKASGVEAAPAVLVAYVFTAHLAQYLPSVVSGLVIVARRHFVPGALRSAMREVSGPSDRQGGRGDPET